MLCNLCPRACGVDRSVARGVCRMGENPVLARAALHRWEEPCVSGERGSGTVFFSGCSLGCVFCQNDSISREGFGREVSVARLREIYEELIAQGAHNINLVSPTHFVPAILRSLEKPLPVPVVYNSGGYERVETLRLLEGKVQVWLPDCKYGEDAPARRYCAAPGYFETAKAAILEMFRQTGPYRLDEDGMIQKGVIIRHLVLPGQLESSRRVIDWVAETFSPGDVLFSLMSQYIPCGRAADFPEINRPITSQEQEEIENYLFDSGIEDGFVQERDAADDQYVPLFDLTGV
ncbi:MAG: radical SAM protein [Oscillospiraceae bacterium]|nr:radical SAM protein [Oscillospiraceae bacterium]